MLNLTVWPDYAAEILKANNKTEYAIVGAFVSPSIWSFWADLSRKMTFLPDGG